MVLDEQGDPAAASAVPSAGSVNDEMDGLMSDWSWRPRRSDLAPPVYVYTPIECLLWELGHMVGLEMSAQQPWSFPAYRGPVARPSRIGVTR